MPEPRPLKIEFPEALPVCARRGEIEAALAAHQVIVVCGETGSGKTTQLPKIALAMGRGRINAAPGKRGQMIGHTQPRRIAASSVARRIAAELDTPPGEVVGYKVRFQDRISRTASIKLMTDGILLAETQSDPLLRAYDTLIIDEAHERSLNIDFLLGWLRNILPRRPDLKIIVTSATIDAQRFAEHFASTKGPAPVIMVSGRTWPVEVRWRPFEEARDYGPNDAIADAVDELWQGNAAGDILVFLPGEREIREAAAHLRGHLSHSPALRSAEVLPLFARLSQAEQDRVFDSHGHRRIVLATNVAETSLTVPGIRFVIDTGTARVKRYSLRSKVEQLLLEPISQAAASQRAGRCGRVANGICIRLYDEQGFAARPRFTDPEILRSSLAGVILRMKSLRLGDVEDFPFLQAPSRRAIADGYQLLGELGAMDDAHELTPTGHELARLPLDPRISRMILEARHRNALPEVLVVAAALSVQDVRDRPLDAQAQADQAHARWDDEKSEFSGWLRLWQWLHDARGGHSDSGDTHRLSNRQYEALLRQNFISVRRVREWRDIHSQLLTVATDQGWMRPATTPPPASAHPPKATAAAQKERGKNTPQRPHAAPQPAGYEALHCAMLAGLLGNVGCKSDSEDVYLGARGIRFYRHPGAHLKRKPGPGRWVVCAELMETSRLFGRGMAGIDPKWLEDVGAHLLKKQLLDPHWEKKAGEVIALERATLYGLVVYNNRRKPYKHADPAGAREIFIREALVAGDWETPLPFLAANQKLVRQVEQLEHKSRRQDVLVDDALIHAFYDSQIPADICTGRDLERWWRAESRANPKLLHLTREELMRHEAAGITTQNFPRTIRLGGVDCNAAYLHEPGNDRDGLTVTVPLFVLNQVSEARCEWLVPGMLKDKIQMLLKSLPQKPRARLVPLPQTAARFADALCAPDIFGNGLLTDALLALVREVTQLDVKRSDFKPDMLNAHHAMNLRIVDEHGRQLAMGRNLGALKAEWGSQARGAFQALAQLKTTAPAAQTTSGNETPPAEHATARPEATTAKGAPPAPDASQRHTDWTFGELPELMEIRRKGQTLVGFPALIDDGDAVAIEVFDEPELAAARHRNGLRRLFALQIRDALRYLEKNIPGLPEMAAACITLGITREELRGQIIHVALERAFLTAPLPTSAAQFRTRVDEGRARLTLIAHEVARLAGAILAEYAQAARKIRDTKGHTEATIDASAQLQRLIPKDFLTATPWGALQHCPRYLKAIALRMDKLRADPARDARLLNDLRLPEQRYWRLVSTRKGAVDEHMQQYRWMLEELRVSLFAQELRTPQPVSLKRLDKAWTQVVG